MGSSASKSMKLQTGTEASGEAVLTKVSLRQELDKMKDDILLALRDSNASEHSEEEDAPLPEDITTENPHLAVLNVHSQQISEMELQGANNIVVTSKNNLDGVHVHSLSTFLQDGHECYFFGGLQQAGGGCQYCKDSYKFVIQDSVCRYNTQSRQWQSLSPILEPGCCSAAFKLGSNIYLVGGRGWNGRIQASVNVYSTNANTWSMCRQLDGVVSDLAAAELDGTGYISGGYSYPHRTLKTI